MQFFVSRLHWQSHFIQKLEDEPTMEFKSLNPEFDALRSNKEDMIKAIFEARTGIPYIDAIVQQLHKIGWTNFRSRALFVSFCSNTCMLPWQEIAPKLASLFTDYEP